MPLGKMLAQGFAVVVVIMVVVVGLCGPGGAAAARPPGAARAGFRSLLPPAPAPARFPPSCAPYDPGAIAHEMESPLLYRCQHQCSTLGPATERPGESCVEQCVWGRADPAPGEFFGKYGWGRGDPWPRRSCGERAGGAPHFDPHIVSSDEEWPTGVVINNVWAGGRFAPPSWQKCFEGCGLDLTCRDDCVSSAAGTAYGL